MSKAEFKESIFNVTEYLVKTELSDTARKLLVHYFNDSSGNTSLDRAVNAITRYIQDDIPASEDRSPLLNELLNDLAYEAKIFDAED